MKRLTFVPSFINAERELIRPIIRSKRTVKGGGSRTNRLLFLSRRRVARERVTRLPSVWWEFRTSRERMGLDQRLGAIGTREEKIEG